MEDEHPILILTATDNRKHSISFENATRELARNKNFRDALETGIYAYVDNCFVIRDSKYLYRNDSGTLHFTSYAKAHMAECCLAFASRRIHPGMQFGMLRYNVEDESFLTGTSLPAEVLAKRSKALATILQELPNTFSETLIAHMKRKGITVEQLAENCLMSTSKVTRIRRDYFTSVSLRNVVSICIGLKLHPSLAMDLIRKAGYGYCENAFLEKVQSKCSQNRILRPLSSYISMHIQKRYANRVPRPAPYQSG